MASWLIKAARLFGLPVPREPRGPLGQVPGSGGWFPVVREPYTGAWQRNEELRADSALAYYAVYACVTLIAADVAKLQLRLVEQDDEGIWHETTNPAYSPVLRTPNRYSTIVKFVERWMVSKLVSGNTYVLKQRDQRGVVVALYVLDPAFVTPLIAPDGSVYYQIKRDDLSWLGDPDLTEITIPASEIIHDLMVPIFHPLCGVTPLYACGLSILQGQSIQRNSTSFFSNGSRPGGILTAPGLISAETAKRLKDDWELNFSGDQQGRVAVLGDGLKYEGMTVNAADAQLIDQLKWSAETVCSCYHVPPYMVAIGPPPPYAHVGILIQQYYAQCIQSLLANFEAALDRGLEFNRPTIGTEFNIDDLSWMDNEARTKAGIDAIAGALLSPNEARRKYMGVGSVKGGDSPMAQQQYYSLAALAERDQDMPFAKPTAATPPAPPPEDEDTGADDLETKALGLDPLRASFEMHFRDRVRERMTA
jgi:HK97 family phage portal protein